MPQREIYMDHLRGFIFALMAFDHALHAYAENWGRFWFIQDFERSPVWDCFYLFDQSIIMPMLFFLVGLNVLPSLKRRGFLDYSLKRFIKLGLPFIVCVPLIVPILTFPKYLTTVDSSMEYGDYLINVFFNGRMQAGPLWVCYGIFLFSFILVFLNALFPSLVPALGQKLYQGSTKKPWQVLVLIISISALLLGLSDITWGAPWWIGFGKLFYLQGARFLLYFLYFILGASVRASGLLEDAAFKKRFSAQWKLWGALMAVSAFAYVGYSMLYFEEGAYNDDFRHWIAEFFVQGGTWPEFWSFMSEYGWEVLGQAAPGVLIRTTLHGILCLFQVLFLLSFFYRFKSSSTPAWQSLARCCYAIFLTHEAMVIWLQYGLIGVELATPFKILIVFTLGFGGSWLLSEKVLLKVPGLRPVLN